MHVFPTSHSRFCPCPMPTCPPVPPARNWHTRSTVPLKWTPVSLAVLGVDTHIVVKSLPAYLSREQVAVDIERACLALLFRCEVNKLRQLHDLASVNGYLSGVVYQPIALDLSIPVLLGKDVDAK